MAEEKNSEDVKNEGTSKEEAVSNRLLTRTTKRGLNVH
jgi:hypothetical protein